MLGVAVNKSPFVNRSESVLSLLTHNADDGSSGQQGPVTPACIAA